MKPNYTGMFFHAYVITAALLVSPWFLVAGLLFLCREAARR